MTLCSLNSVSAAQRKIRLRLCIIEPLFTHLKCRANLLLISSGKDSFHTRFLLGVPDSRKGSTWGSSLFHTRFLLGVPRSRKGSTWAVRYFTHAFCLACRISKSGLAFLQRVYKIKTTQNRSLCFGFVLNPHCSRTGGTGRIKIAP